MNSSKESEKTREPNPVLKANFLSKWLFFWTRHIFKKGLKEKFEEDDLYKNVPFLDSNKLTKYFAENWKIELKSGRPNLFRMILRTYGPKVLPICVLFSMFDITMQAIQPIFIDGLVSYYAHDERHILKNQAYLYGAGFIVSNLLISIFYNTFNYSLFLKGMHVRMACAGLVYQKCLNFPLTADTSRMSAVAISVLSKDLSQFESTLPQIQNLWKGPLEIFVFSFIMWYLIGWQGVVGIIIFIIVTPIQAWAAKAAGVFRRKLAKYGDERVNFMNEIIAAIQVIKMYAWEGFFAKQIAAIRKRELKFIAGAMKINACIISSVMISKFALFISLLTYLYTGELVTANRIFIATSFYARLNESVMINWTMAITSWAETIVCIRRVNDFLLESNDKVSNEGFDNFGADLVEKVRQVPSNRICNPMAKEKCLRMLKISSSWDKLDDSRERTLHIKDISCKISDGQFVGIIGNVGSGKTTLLSTIIGEIELAEGNLEINGNISYASQVPWIFGGSIRDNIVFVEKFDEKRYKDVLYACELGRDIELLQHGDSTVIGERGVSLSGGQRARVNLARAIYSQADIYLFDDPLSAVDTLVGRRLMDKCFHKFLEGKIRILVTHQMQYMHYVNHVVLMEDGTIKKQGTYGELRELILKEMQAEQPTVTTDLTSKSKFQHNINLLSLFDENLLKNKDNDIKQKEYQAHGSVQFKTYWTYFQSLQRPFLAISIISLFILARASQAILDVFVARWAYVEEKYLRHEISKTEHDAERQNYLIVYAAVILAALGLFLLRTFGFFYMCYKISLRLHDRLFNGIIRAYMNFFDTNPSGRILNRFSNDMWKADVKLPQAMLDCFWFFVDVTAILLIVGLTNVWLLIPAFSMIGLLILSRDLYLRSGRNLKRIESITCSPVYSHVNQTFQGLTTIRALKAKTQLVLEFHELQNTNSSASYLLVSTNRAFALWIDVMCCIYITLVITSFLFFERQFYSHQIGLAITQSMLLLGKCQLGVRRTADMENIMTSVERILEYIRIPTEPNLEISKDAILNQNWPSIGSIAFKNLHMRYSKLSPYTLKGLNFSINPREKIGIVGRTGAGKSSIIQAIFRLAINEGDIEIDDVDISKLGLQHLRSRISIIPQEPVLFTGTLRYNLDPFEEKTDDEMWRALEDVELKSYVMSLEGGLECRVYDGGINFSTGQRQLVCLARAILRHNKILIMDEATANVDPHTDKLIQETIQRNFSECTVLTIAHRLHTVMHTDRVLVMEAGRVVEFNHPHILLQNKSGKLYKMVQQTGKTTADHLILVAKERFENLASKNQ